MVQPQHHTDVLVDPHGHVVTRHHDSYQYVIPATRPNLGTYYTLQNQQYYMPPAQIVRGQTAYVAPTPVAFGGYTRFEDLSGRIESAANEVCLDLHYNYQANAGYQEVYREAYSLLQQAKALHAAEHHQDRNYIRGAVEALDGLLHHVAGDASRLAPQVVRPIGQYALPDKLAQLESMIHHLMHDVGIAPHAEGTEQAPPPGDVEQAPPPSGFGVPPGFPQSQLGPPSGSSLPFSAGGPNLNASTNGQPGVFLNVAPPDTVTISRP